MLRRIGGAARSLRQQQFARGLLKLRDHLAKLGGFDCGQDLHVLCHSMGNYVLQNALERMRQFTPGSALPRLFDHVFASKSLFR